MKTEKAEGLLSLYRREAVKLHREIKRLQQCVEMACQEPSDDCECPGCQYAAKYWQETEENNEGLD